MNDNSRPLRLLIGFLIGLLVVIVAAPGVSAQATDPAKPDVHVTFDIHADGSNVTMVEVAVHPLLDPTINQALTWLSQQLPKGSGKPTFELRNTTREGRKYAALVITFSSLGDLNAFINTPQFIETLVGLGAPGTRIPAPFAEFRAWHDSSQPEAAYGLRAMMTAETTKVTAPINLTLHLRLPQQVKQHNGTISGTELSWFVQPGQPLTISETAGASSVVERLFPIGSTPAGSGSVPWWIVVIVVVVLAIVVAAAVVLRKRALTPAEREDEET